MRGAKFSGTGMYRYICSLSAILLLAGTAVFTQVAYATSETRYMCGNVTIGAGILGTEQCPSDYEPVLKTKTGSGGGTIYWGIRVWKRDIEGGETEITSGTPVAQVSRDAAGEGTQSATWVCLPTVLEEDDFIVVEVYMDVNGTGWGTASAEFTTGQLNATSLEIATWTVCYYTEYETQATGKPADRFTMGTFYWGSAYSSRIEDFSWTHDPVEQRYLDVDDVNSDPNNPGYQYPNHSFTIVEAIGAAQPGDIIRVHPTDSTPDYTERVVVDKPNIIIAASNRYDYDSEATPEIQDTGAPAESETERNAFTIKTSYVTLEGLNITYAPNNCIQIEGENAVVDGCSVYGWEACSDIDGKTGGIVVLAEGGTIRNSKIDGRGGFVTTPFVGAIFTGVNTGTFGPNNTIEYIVGTQLSGSVCLYSPAANPSVPGLVEIFENTIENCYSGVYFHNNYAASELTFRAYRNEVMMSDSMGGSGGRGLQVSCIDSTSKNTVVFEKNTVWSLNPATPGTYGVKAYNITDFSNNTITLRNIYAFSIYTGIDTQMGGGDGAHGIKAYNNTIYDFHFRGVDLRPPLADPSTHWTLRNNIFHSDTPGACGIYVPNGADEGFSSDYNDIYIPDGIVGDWIGTVCQSLEEWKIASGGDVHSISADPIFASGGPPHISIETGNLSPCIDAGQTILSVTDDIDGDARPLGNAHDIGADEASIGDGGTEMRVSSVAVSLVKSIKGQKVLVYAVAEVSVAYYDEQGSHPVSGATVTGEWSGVVAGTASDETDEAGNVSFTSETVRNPTDGSEFTFTVTGMSHPNYKWGDVTPPSGTATYYESTGSSALLASFPNPANPETWIPFKLSQAEHVVIRIHDMTGRLVRTLELGQKAPGAYISKEKAAYWDGKNEAGEYVSSGVYFYTIQAGDFTATKKMLIAK